MGSGLHHSAGSRAVEGLLAVGAEVEETAGARACGSLGLGEMCRWRAATPAGTQRFVLLQIAGGLHEETKTHIR